MFHLKAAVARGLAAILLLAGASAGQNATVSGVTLLEQGGEVVVSYDLEAQGEVPVVLMGSEDGGRIFDLLMERATGDVGTRVAPGKGRKIQWSAEKEFPGRVHATELVLKVVAGAQAAEILRATGGPQPAQTDTDYAEDVLAEQERVRGFLEQRREELLDLAQEEKRVRTEIERLDSAAFPDERRPEDRARWEERRAKDRDSAYRRLNELQRLQDVTQSKIRQLEKDLKDLADDRKR
jgi:hypothetical protein